MLSRLSTSLWARLVNDRFCWPLLRLLGANVFASPNRSWKTSTRPAALPLCSLCCVIGVQFFSKTWTPWSRRKKHVSPVSWSWS